MYHYSADRSELGSIIHGVYVGKEANDARALCETCANKQMRICVFGIDPRRIQSRQLLFFTIAEEIPHRKADCIERQRRRHSRLDSSLIAANLSRSTRARENENREMKRGRETEDNHGFADSVEKSELRRIIYTNPGAVISAQSDAGGLPRCGGVSKCN